MSRVLGSHAVPVCPSTFGSWCGRVVSCEGPQRRMGPMSQIMQMIPGMSNLMPAGPGFTVS